MKPRLILSMLALLALGGCAGQGDAATGSLSSSSKLTSGSPQAGKFTSDLIVKVLEDGRSLELAEPFEYVDSNGKRWVVPKGERVDGASIPVMFWSMIGGPFSGRYRRASVVHDFFCGYRVRTSDQVHNVFYDAMRASGVGLNKAKMMFFAVLRFGPSWKNVSQQHLCQGTHKPQALGLSEQEASACKVKTRGGFSRSPASRAKYNKRDFLEAKKAIEAGNLSLAQIRALAVSQRP